ncbi:hypothetical protein Agub_g7035, partial [Astrephomene gubernaculifera]
HVAPQLLADVRHLTLLTQLTLSVSCVRPYEPLVESLPYLSRTLTHLHLFLHVPSTPPPLPPPSPHSHSGGSGAGGGKLSYNQDLSPDLAPVHLAAAVSQCSRLVSLELPGEDLEGRVPMVLQALPGLTRLSARQLGPWELSQPHTALASLHLPMSWPEHLAPLLPSLPRLKTLAADLYIH